MRVEFGPLRRRRERVAEAKEFSRDLYKLGVSIFKEYGSYTQTPDREFSLVTVVLDDDGRPQRLTFRKALIGKGLWVYDNEPAENNSLVFSLTRTYVRDPGLKKIRDMERLREVEQTLLNARGFCQRRIWGAPQLGLVKQPVSV